ncbi:MAG: IS66 family insertion sequence element accessory protein TnpB, partial [Verrucomicrobiaceae bacterium]|nr:IS66 family insertion sequence element accessory protein TnpB [Verrucomicrobiaceae bacterium]
MNQRKSPDQWCAILADYERSGLSQADFCRRHRLALST